MTASAVATDPTPRGTANEPRLRFRPDIEGIRGIAILLVVGFHAGIPALAAGFIGVDVFFVLSGYLITGLILQEVESTGGLSFVNFYARRARRLLPALTLALVVTLLAATVIYSPIELLPLSRTAQAVAAYLANIRFARDAVDYLGARDADPLLHTWSLAVEEQFYVVWPVLVGGLAWVAHRTRRRGAVALGMGAVVVASFTLCVVQTRTIQPWAFFGTPARFWEFGVGGLAALVPASGILTNRRFRQALAVAGAAAVLGTVILLDDGGAFPGAIAAVPVLGTAAVLVGGSVDPNDRSYAALRNRSLQWFGRHSYSWYLWHWPFIVFTAAVWPRPPIAATLPAAGAALALSMLTYRLVEHPIRASTALRRRPVVSVVGGVALAAVGLTAALAIQAYAQSAVARPSQQQLVRASTDNPPMNARCVVTFVATAIPDDCVFGERRGRDAIVLFGDSHAAQWFPAVDRIAKSHGLRLVVLAKASCPTASVDELHNDNLGRRYHECATWRRAALQRILELRPRLTIAANASAYVRDDDSDARALSASAWEAGHRRTAQVIARAGLAQALLVDPPTPGFDLPVCLSRRAAQRLLARECDFARSDRINESARGAETAAFRDVPRVTLADLSSRVCPRPRCAPRAGGLVVFSDSNHLTATFAATLAPDLEALLRRFL